MPWEADSGVVQTQDGTPASGGRHRTHLFLLFTLWSFLLIPVAGADLGAQPGNHDLGDLARGAQASTTVLLRNGGASDLEITSGFEADDGTTFTATPVAFTLAAGAEQSVQILLQIAADAAPGRHTARFIASASDAGDGTQAVGAIAVQLHFSVVALDVAYAEVGDNKTVFLRVVNGYDAARIIHTTIHTSGPTGAIETATLPNKTVGARGNLLSYHTLLDDYPNGTYTLRIEGTATGGPSTEAFTATYTLTRDGNGFTTDAHPPAAVGRSGGGGGNAGPTDEEAPAHTGGSWSPDVLTYPVPEGHTDPRDARVDSTTGGDASPGAGAQRDPLPPDLETVEDAVAYSMVAVAVALVAGVAVFLGRGRFFL